MVPRLRPSMREFWVYLSDRAVVLSVSERPVRLRDAERGVEGVYRSHSPG